MTSDEERRETAARLRALHENHDWYDFDQEVDGIESAVGCNYGQPHVSQGLLLRLADLIDRPTCRDLSERSGEFASDVFTCSACGNEIATWDGAGGWLDVRYCPFCGAEVVCDD